MSITIPYLPQRGNSAKNDCGPACVLMITRAFGKGMDVTIDQLSKQIDPDDNGTSSKDLMKALERFGLTPRVGTKATVGYPCIALVRMENLPLKNRSDPNLRTLHWIVILSPSRYHDPYHFGTRGANLPITEAEMDAAEVGARITTKELEAAMSGAFARTPYARRYLIPWRGDARWPQYPGATVEQLALLDQHRRVNRFTLGDSFDDAGLGIVTLSGERGTNTVELWGFPNDPAVRKAFTDFFDTHYRGTVVLFKDWSELQARPPVYDITVTPSTITRGQTATVAWHIENVQAAYVNDQGVTGPRGEMKVSPPGTTNYVLRVVTQAGSSLTKTATLTVNQPSGSGLAIGVHPALPQLPFHLRLGMHVMNRQEELEQCYNLGCRSFTILDNMHAARWARDRGCAVILRRFFEHGPPPSPEQAVQMLGIGAGDRLMVMGLNEADNISTSDLVNRFAWDKRFAELVWQVAPNCFPLIGSFSMGTPQIDDPGVARLWRETYGAFLNANAHRVGLNYHSYHRRHSARVPPWNHPVEDAQWWPQRFTRYGFNPSFGGLSDKVVIVGDETGVDIGGIGGFPACGYNDNTFLEWWALRKAEYSPFPQIYVQNIFQLSPAENWRGYHAGAVLGGCERVWKGQA